MPTIASSAVVFPYCQSPGRSQIKVKDEWHPCHLLNAEHHAGFRFTAKCDVLFLRGIPTQIEACAMIMEDFLLGLFLAMLYIGDLAL